MIDLDGYVPPPALVDRTARKLAELDGHDWLVMDGSSPIARPWIGLRAVYAERASAVLAVVGPFVVRKVIDERAQALEDAAVAIEADDVPHTGTYTGDRKAAAWLRERAAATA